MCGLVGIAGDTLGKCKDMFTELLVIDSLRGMHSTGAAVVRRWQDKIDLVKRPGPSHLLINDQEYKSALNPPAKVLLGHNRYATRGAHTKDNAHPFEFEHVVGAHNGTLDSWSSKKLHLNEKFDTDSEAIFAHINEYGIEDAVKYFAGAWALTWYDRRNNSVNFLRNSQRPLFYCYNKDHTAMMWASEIEMLDFVLKRNNVKEQDHAFYKVSQDVLTTWILPEKATDQLPEPIMVDLPAPAYVAPKKTTTYGYGGAFGQWQDEDLEDWVDMYPEYDFRKQLTEDKKKEDATFRVGTMVQNSASTGNGTGSNVLPFKPDPPKVAQGCHRINTKKFRPPYKDDKGRAVPKKSFYQIVQNGCVFCGDNSADWGSLCKDHARRT